MSVISIFSRWKQNEPATEETEEQKRKRELEEKIARDRQTSNASIIARFGLKSGTNKRKKGDSK